MPGESQNKILSGLTEFAEPVVFHASSSSVESEANVLQT
jgi:hypothetical protein